MQGFVLSNAAKTDLKAIGRYTQATWGIDQRNRYLTLLDGCFHNLAANPLMGRDCSDIGNGYRKQAIGKHVVFYRQSEPHLIEIIRILHERMDVETRLSDS
jgi:toxin ParE1/3/4